MSDRFAFHTDESFQDRETGRFIVARVDADAAGYFVYATYPTLDLARAAADDLNFQYDVSRDDAAAIYASSMASSIALHADMAEAVDPAGRMRDAMDAAEAAFYATLAAAYPDARTGDLDAETAARFTVACQKVAAAWLAANDPEAMAAITDQLRAELTARP